MNAHLTPFLLLVWLTVGTAFAAKDKFLTTSGGQSVQVTSADGVDAYSNATSAVTTGDAVYLSASNMVAKASASTTGQPVLGLVYEITNSTHCIVLRDGVFANFSTGMTTGTAYYLAETAGTLQTTPVLASGKLAQFVGIAVSATDLLVQPQNMSLSGTSAGKLVALDYAGKLPAVDGSALTNLPAGGGPETDPVATLLLSDGSGVTDVPGWWEAIAPGGLLPSLDGSRLTNLPVGGESGKAFYLNATDASDISGYKIAQPTPSVNAESTLVQANTGTGWTLVDEFATPIGSPSVTSLPMGTASRNIWAKVDHASAVANIKIEIYKRTAGGTETLLRDGTSGAFGGVVPVMVTWAIVDPLSYSLNLTDRLVFKIYTARISGPASVSVTLYFEGVDHASYVRSTIAETSPALTALAVVGSPTAADQILKSTADGVWSLAAAAASPGPYDWADPYYEQAGDSLSAVLLADWPDAADAGGASSIYRDQILGRALRLKPAFAADGVTDYGSTNRAGGILRSIGAGAFRVALRYSISTATLATAPSIVMVGPAFVDGTNAEADSWYGWGQYVSGVLLTGLGATGPTIYSIKNEAGAARWETYDGGYTFLAYSPGWVQIDVVLERSGTTLTCYMGQARGALSLLSTHTVTTGAGLIGLRHESLNGGADEVDVTLLAYRTGLSEVP